MPLKRRPFVVLFWSKVSSSDMRDPKACWHWRGAVGSGGYGNTYDNTGGKRYLNSHRAAYELTFGPIPKGLRVCHTCDNPLCCNPSHLYLGTQQENMLDMALRRRRVRWSDEDVVKLKALVEKGFTYKAAGAVLGISESTVGTLMRGGRKYINT